MWWRGRSNPTLSETRLQGLKFAAANQDYNTLKKTVHLSPRKFSKAFRRGGCEHNTVSLQTDKMNEGNTSLRLEVCVHTIGRGGLQGR